MTEREDDRSGAATVFAGAAELRDPEQYRKDRDTAIATLIEAVGSAATSNGFTCIPTDGTGIEVGISGKSVSVRLADGKVAVGSGWAPLDYDVAAARMVPKDGAPEKSAGAAVAELVIRTLERTPDPSKAQPAPLPRGDRGRV